MGGCMSMQGMPMQGMSGCMPMQGMPMQGMQGMQGMSCGGMPMAGMMGMMPQQQAAPAGMQQQQLQPDAGNLAVHDISHIDTLVPAYVPQMHARMFCGACWLHRPL